MNTLFVCLLASVLVVYGCEDNLQESKQQDTNCVNYCSNIINPVLNVTRNLQNQVNDFKHQTKCLSQFENTNKMMEEKFALQDKKIEQKLGDLSTASEQIMQQIKSQFEHLHKMVEVKKQIPGPPYQQIGSKYYYIEESEELSWFEAVNKCLSMDGHLVSIQNLDEFNAIKQKLQSGNNYWIDINVLANKDEYTSISTGRRVNFFMWQSGEPYNISGNYNCCMLNPSKEFKMFLNICRYKRLFICEFRN